MNGQNSWMGWAIAIGVLIYWLMESNATSAANANQVGVPPGSKVVGSTVYNSAGQVIGSVTSAGYYQPTIATTTASSNPLTGTTVNQASTSTYMNQPLSGGNCPAGKTLYDVGDLVPVYVCK